MRVIKQVAILFIVGPLFLASASGQSTQAKSKAQKERSARKNKNPAMQPVEDVAGLPRVLLIGDSISIGYTVAVREALSGQANVHRPLTNCSSTRTGAAKVQEWLGDKPWDVIHFNFGLHDLKYVVGDSAQLVALGTEGSHKQVPLDEYRRNLTKIVETLKRTDAKLVWCNTTPVPEGAKGRIPADVERYNQAAEQIMRKAGVTIHDLNAHAAEKIDKIQRSKDVHFFPKGSAYLAESVVGAVKKHFNASKE